MTQEEKARAYDEALKTAKRIISKNCSKVEKLCLKCIFPELAESEDEKMINELQGFLDSFGADYFGTGEWQKFHDWLEKQKEQKPVDLVAELKLHLANTPKEQLEKEWKELEPYGNIGPTVHEFLYGEQPAEWSEEDEKNLNLCIEFVESCEIDYDAKPHYSTWLKSLPERFNLQPKQEWSKEDENIYNKALDVIYYKDLNDKDEVVDSLKALCDLIARKRKVIPPYAHWKPSEEQMEWLKSAVRLSTNKPHIHGIIISLYEQLKRL